MKKIIDVVIVIPVGPSSKINRETSLKNAFSNWKLCFSLQNIELRSNRLQEDHIFNLLVRSTGFEIGDFATRFWQEMNEEMIREFFRKKRKNNTFFILGKENGSGVKSYVVEFDQDFKSAA